MTPQNILVPIDFSQPSERALDYACALGAKLGARIHLIHAMAIALPEVEVTLGDSIWQSLRTANTAALAKLADPRRALVTFGEVLVRDGDPRDVILEVARSLDIDMIVMGSHGRRGFIRLVLGSVAEDVSRRASCPIVLVHVKKNESL